MQQCTLIDFMEGAKKLRGTVMADKGHREAIFSDTVLREMGLELPTNVEEMLAIPNIRPEMVDLYGKRFLKLIKNTRDLYEKNVPERKFLPPYRQTIHDSAEEDQDEDEVLDPNHLNVIDLCDSDADTGLAAEEIESDYSYADEDEEEEEELHISHHFTQQQDPEVEAFNNRMSQLGTAVPKAASTSRAPSVRGGSKAPGAKKGRPYRKNGSGSFGGKSFGGIKKRATKASSSRASGGAAATKKAAGGGRKGGGGSGAGGQLAGGWGSIMAMPT
jgi:bloom syndrome protein